MRSCILVDSLSGGATGCRGFVPAEPAKLSPVCEPRLHSRRALVVRDKRRFERLIQRQAQWAARVERLEQQVFLAIETLVINGVLVTMHSEVDVLALERGRQPSAARTLCAGDRVAR